jgi:hypothetical protein
MLIVMVQMDVNRLSMRLSKASQKLSRNESQNLLSHSRIFFHMIKHEGGFEFLFQNPNPEEKDTIRRTRSLPYI